MECFVFSILLGSQARKNNQLNNSQCARQISTKKKGPISDECKATDDTKDCSKELDDVTKYYKAKENSGPGLPTKLSHRLKYDLPEGTPPDEYYNPVSGGSHRNLRRQRRAQEDIAPTITFGNLGVAPGSSSTPLINEPGHYYSSAHVRVNMTNTGTVSETVLCSIKVVALDYAGRNYSNVVHEESVTEVVGAGEKGACTMSVKREQYREFTATYLDTDLEALEINEVAYQVSWFALTIVFPKLNPNTNTINPQLKFITTAIVPRTSQIYLNEQSKLICTPKIAYSTRSGGVVCEGTRGSTAISQASALAHLLTCVPQSGTSAAGYNDGVCTPSLNVEEECYDGGDCCGESCWARNGNMYELGGGGELQFAHECWNADEREVGGKGVGETCVDPVFKNGDWLPPFDYSTPSRPSSYTGAGAPSFGESICPSLVSNVTSLIASDLSSSCLDDVDSASCKALLSNVFCKDENYNRALVDCEEELRAETPLGTNNRPRCSRRTEAGCRCKKTWSFGMDDDDVDEVTFEDWSCGNPDGDEGGEWCDIVVGSCR